MVNNLLTAEHLSQQTGRSYRTVKKRLAEAGIEPALVEKNRRYYEPVEALAAVRFGQISRPTDSKFMADSRESIGRYIFPMLFGSGSELVNILLGYLHAECGLAKEQVVQAVLLAAQGCMMRLDQFHGAEGHYQPSNFMEAAARHGKDRTAFVREIWPDTPNPEIPAKGN